MAVLPIILQNGTTADANEVMDNFYPLYSDIDNSNIANGAGIVFSKLDANTVAGVTAVQTLTNKTLVTPTIASFVNAQHNHLNAAGGGTLDAAAITSGTFADARISQSSVTQYVNALESNLDHNSLQNLTVGDPHTQYAELAANEGVTGTWTFPSAPASPAVNGAYQQGFCKGYINCSSNGVAYTINASLNIDTVASVYDAVGGYFKVFFNTPFSAANTIICSGTSVRDDGAGVPDSDIVSCTPVSTTQVNVRVYDTTGGNQTAPANGSAFSIAFFGVQ